MLSKEECPIVELGKLCSGHNLYQDTPFSQVTLHTIHHTIHHTIVWKYDTLGCPHCSLISLLRYVCPLRCDPIIVGKYALITLPRCGCVCPHHTAQVWVCVSPSHCPGVGVCVLITLPRCGCVSPHHTAQVWVCVCRNVLLVLSSCWFLRHKSSVAR